MSLIQRTKQGFLRLPFLKKVVLLSSLGLMISTVMPWYDERNSFGVGESYLGIQGPFFLIGLMVLGFGAISFFHLFLPLTGKNFFKTKGKSGLTSFFLGIQSLLLLIVANSIFYHPDFGANISSKSTRFGMTFAFISLGLMALSGWLSRNKEDAESEEVIEDFEERIPPVMRSYEAPLHPEAIRSEPMDVPVQTSFSQPRAQASSTPAPYSGGATPSVDPLTLDPRTRYKLMQSRMRKEGTIHSGPNFWGNGSGTARFGSVNPSVGNSSEVSDNMKIRMDL